MYVEMLYCFVVMWWIPDNEVVRGWLSKALDAPRGNQWVCENCGIVHGDWAAICTNCDGFDTIDWRRPQAVKAAEGGMQTLGFTASMLAGSPRKDADQKDVGVTNGSKTADEP